MKLALAAVAALALTALPAMAAEATFERNLTVSGPVELTVNTGAGNVHVTRGSSSQIHVFGRVRSGWGGSEARVREIAANPPIEQTGSIVHIGLRNEQLHNIRIDLEIQAPADSYLEASSGSGDVTVEGVGKDAKLTTGSGNVHATGLQGSLTLHTGSGDIYAEQRGSGDVRAQTGSGNVELHDVNGGLRATTGSGDIKVAGVVGGDWQLATGSGSIEFWPGAGGFTLDASTGSGSVHTDREMSVQGFLDHHHITGKVNGGGPKVRIQTGSGDVRIH